VAQRPHAEGHAGTHAVRPVLSAQPTRDEIKQGTARAIRCTIYAQSLQVNPPNPAVLRGTLRLPLRGDHGHVPRPHIDPISLYMVSGVVMGKGKSGQRFCVCVCVCVGFRVSYCTGGQSWFEVHFGGLYECGVCAFCLILI